MTEIFSMEVRRMKCDDGLKLGLVIVLSTLMTIFAANTFAQPAGPSEEFNFMERADKNKDGKVTKDELPMPDRFPDLDKNGDNVRPKKLRKKCFC